MKKILFLVTTLYGGGAEKVLVDLVNLLPKDKYDVTLQTIIDDGPNRNRLDESIKYKTIISNSKGITFKIKSMFIHKVLPSRFVYNSYIKDNYDIEVAFLEGIPTKLIAFSSSKKSKKIAWVHIDISNMFGSSSVYRNFAENKKCYQQYDKIACVSDAVKESFVARFGEFGEKVQTVYNLIPDDAIKIKGKEKIGIFKHDFPIIISCGRFSEEKGFSRLLRIHNQLLKDGLKHYLWIVGDGMLRSDFEKYISENGLEDTVKLLGFQDNPYKYISKADLFVCSSVAEGYSLVISEAVVLGVPVISTDVSGAREPIEYPRCYKIVGNNEESLYQELKHVLQNPKQLIVAKKITIQNSVFLNKEIQLNKIIEFLGE